MDKPRFVLHTCLGSGGFGEVYLATERTEGGITREVAVKVLHEPLDEDSDAVRRLRDEGQLLAMLAHPSILGVHAFAPVDDRLALVTEYVDGVDLAWFCVPERLLPLRVSILIVQQVAEALDFAWRTPNPKTERPLHLIHRDIKPENIRLSTTGQVKVLDFGVARSTEIDRRAKTALGQVVLTPGYGAPETLSFGVTGPFVDVFALGATLYSMVTGEMFYESNDLGVHVLLASDSVDYKEHLEARLALIEHTDVFSLLRDMLEFAHEHRPTMEEIAERCDRLARRLEGPSLLQWTRSAEFPESSNAEGSLVGAEVMYSGEIRMPQPDLPGVAPSPPAAPPSLADTPLPTWIDDDPSEPPPDTTPPTPPAIPSITPEPAPSRDDLMPPAPAPRSEADTRLIGLALVLVAGVLVMLGLVGVLVAMWVL